MKMPLIERKIFKNANLAQECTTFALSSFPMWLLSMEPQFEFPMLSSSYGNSTPLLTPRTPWECLTRSDAVDGFVLDAMAVCMCTHSEKSAGPILC